MKGDLAMQFDACQTEARLERLERENARLSKSVRRANLVMGGVALVALVIVGTGAMQGPGPVDASRLNIIGPNGKARVIIGVTDQGAAEMDFYDAGGDSHIRMEVDAPGGHSALRMRNIKDQMRIDFGINPQSEAGVLVINGIPK